jgi:hypothetical protein
MSATLTDAGYPRPIIEGYPIPWVSPAENLGTTNGDRILATKEQGLCQVCGLAFASEEEVVVFVTAETKESHASVDLSTALCRATDDAVMHPRCAKLAAGRCPKLQEVQEEGRFSAYQGPVEAVQEYDAPEEEHDPARRATYTFVALKGSAARSIDIGAGI